MATTPIIQRSLPAIEVRFNDTSATLGEIEGYGAVFDTVPDSYGSMIAPGAFARSLQDKHARGEPIAMLWAHEMASPIGRWESLTEDHRGLKVRGRLNLNSERGRQALEHIRSGDVNGLSVGFTADPDKIEFRSDGTHIYHDIDLCEVSVVAVPAIRDARITAVRSLGSVRELETLLQENGLSRAAASRIASGGWPALSGSDPGATNLLAIVQAATNSLKRDNTP